jgi:RNA polymerase sigma-70 factor (ECF subfamily)
MAPESNLRGGQAFPTTHWSLILDRGDAASRARSLAFLAAAYRRPLLAYVRRLADVPAEDAKDLAQDFLLWVLETDFLSRADPSKGGFRPFLKTALRHFLADAKRREQARKRGGGQVVFSLEGGDEAPTDVPDPASSTPEQALDELWRTQVLESAVRRLEDALTKERKARSFAVFRDYFLSQQELDYRAVAQRHGISTGDVSNALRFAKRRYREEIRAVVRETVRDPKDLEEELRWLLGEAAP